MFIHELTPVEGTTLLGGTLAPAHDLVGVLHRDIAVWARNEGAEGLATLADSAVVIVALGHRGLRDGDVALRAADGVAERGHVGCPCCS